MKFLDTKSPVSEDDIRGVEGAIGFSLPEDLRSHYLRSNGGRPESNIFRHGDEDFVIHEFLPMKYGEQGERFEDTYKSIALTSRLFPKELLPIASDSCGDYFCYCVRGDQKGAIIFYQSDYFDDPARASVSLAGSLDEFLEKLVSEE